MATTVAAGSIGTALIALTASTVETVNFAGTISVVEVVSPASNTAVVWYTLDGSTPAIDGPKCYYLPPGSVDTRAVDNRPGAGVVKMISSGTPSVRVQAPQGGI